MACRNMIKLVESTRGHIILDIDGAVIEFQGEAFLRGHGSPDFVIYANEIYDKINDTHVEPQQAKPYLDALLVFAGQKGWKIEIE